jgi:DNA invertase Pin-like site-specific DNA recombinase
MTEIDSEKSLIGYARVSTVGQTLDSQLKQLRGAGCTKIYREKVTGARADRRQLLDMLAHPARLRANCSYLPGARSTCHRSSSAA